jgi:hypothetical protein
LPAFKIGLGQNQEFWKHNKVSSPQTAFLPRRKLIFSADATSEISQKT